MKLNPLKSSWAVALGGMPGESDHLYRKYYKKLDILKELISFFHYSKDKIQD